MVRARYHPWRLADKEVDGRLALVNPQPTASPAVGYLGSVLQHHLGLTVPYHFSRIELEDWLWMLHLPQDAADEDSDDSSSDPDARTWEMFWSQMDEGLFQLPYSLGSANPRPTAVHMEPFLKPPDGLKDPSPSPRRHCRSSCTDSIMAHVQQFTFYAPPTFGKDEQNRFITDVRTKYTRALMLMDNTTKKARQIDDVLRQEDTW
ncbi:hypothetical protein PG984_011070 [Apiospora sp. TS-2023a]